eukprot:TRINITY_DN2012_c0_g1_i1.p1 TRINITY_DN2012_c0_g1~~TRINITY_DN2012_c0_g1_i1.p1  ORF type:complete len:196 (-),score=34.54 TRINITY_DN2012_c0_g1_i1:30-617(-)
MSLGGSGNDEFNRAMQALMMDNPPSAGVVGGAATAVQELPPILNFEPTWWQYCLMGAGVVVTLAGIGLVSRHMGWILRTRNLSKNLIEYHGDTKTLFQKVGSEGQPTIWKFFGKDYSQDRADAMMIASAFENDVQVYLLSGEGFADKQENIGWVLFSITSRKQPVPLSADTSVDEVKKFIRTNLSGPHAMSSHFS